MPEAAEENDPLNSNPHDVVGDDVIEEEKDENCDEEAGTGRKVLNSRDPRILV